MRKRFAGGLEGNVGEDDELGGLQADLAASSISGCASQSSMRALACFLAILTPCSSLLHRLSTNSPVDPWSIP